MSFFSVLYKSFIENDFYLIDGFFDKDFLDEKSIFVGLYKNTGNFIYCIILLNEVIFKENYEVYINDINQKVEKVFSNINDTNVIFLNIVVTEKVTHFMCDFAEKFYFDSNSYRNDLCWIADCSNKKIISGKNQPNKILNIHKIILSSFGKKGEFQEDSYFQISQSIRYNKKQQLKTNDSFVTFILIILNLIIFAVMEINGGSENIENLIKFGAVSSELVFEKKEFFRLFTDIFVHIGFAHIASNCLSLYILGTRSEKYFGKVLFLIIYILSGIGASLASIFFTDGISAGASGAIFGIMGAMLMYSIINQKSMEGFSGYFMVIFSLINISAGFFMNGIDNAGHIGGFITGAFLSFIYFSAIKK